MTLVESWPEKDDRHPSSPSSPSLADAWPCFGVPETIAIDNGKDYLSGAFTSSCLLLGMSIINCPPRKAWYKAVIERFGRTINLRLIHWLKGTTKGLMKNHIEYDAKAAATYELDELRRLLEHYIVEIHNHTPRRGKKGTPLQRWERGIATYPPKLPINAEDFDATISMPVSRALRQEGITYMYLQYNNYALGKLWHRLGDRTKVSVRINPIDLTYIYVIDPRDDQPIRVECKTEFTYPPHLDYHIEVVKETRHANLDPHIAHNRTVAERRLREAIHSGNKKKRHKKLRRKDIHLQHTRMESMAPDSAPSKVRDVSASEAMRRRLLASREDTP